MGSSNEYPTSHSQKPRNHRLPYANGFLKVSRFVPTRVFSVVGDSTRSYMITRYEFQLPSIGGLITCENFLILQNMVSFIPLRTSHSHNFLLLESTHLTLPVTEPQLSAKLSYSGGKLPVAYHQSLKETVCTGIPISFNAFVERWQSYGLTTEQTHITCSQSAVSVGRVVREESDRRHEGRSYH